VRSKPQRWGLGFLVHIKPAKAIENPERMLLGL
jgi:hypothetical protein